MVEPHLKVWKVRLIVKLRTENVRKRGRLQPAKQLCPLVKLLLAMKKRQNTPRLVSKVMEAQKPVRYLSVELRKVKKRLPTERVMCLVP